MHYRHRIIIVEDDMLQAMDLELALLEQGYDIIGIAATNADAFLLIEETSPSFAVLDYNLMQLTSVPTAIKLRDAGIPFVIVTGQLEELKLDTSVPPVRAFEKPYIQSELLRFISAQLGAP